MSLDSIDHHRRKTDECTDMSWTNDRAVPMAHHDIVSILETIRARAVSNTLLALLELLEQTEVTRDFCHVSETDQYIERSIDAPLAMVEERKRLYSDSVAEGACFGRWRRSQSRHGRQRPGRHRLLGEQQELVTYGLALTVSRSQQRSPLHLLPSLIHLHDTHDTTSITSIDNVPRWPGQSIR